MKSPFGWSQVFWISFKNLKWSESKLVSCSRVHWFRSVYFILFKDVIVCLSEVATQPILFLFRNNIWARVCRKIPPTSSTTSSGGRWPASVWFIDVSRNTENYILTNLPIFHILRRSCLKWNSNDSSILWLIVTNMRIRSGLKRRISLRSLRSSLLPLWIESGLYFSSEERVMPNSVTKSSENFWTEAGTHASKIIKRHWSFMSICSKLRNASCGLPL